MPIALIYSLDHVRGRVLGYVCFSTRPGVVVVTLYHTNGRFPSRAAYYIIYIIVSRII